MVNTNNRATFFAGLTGSSSHPLNVEATLIDEMGLGETKFAADLLPDPTGVAGAR